MLVFLALGFYVVLVDWRRCFVSGDVEFLLFMFLGKGGPRSPQTGLTLIEILVSLLVEVSELVLFASVVVAACVVFLFL